MKRRDFLKNISAAIATAPILPSMNLIAQNREVKQSDPIKQVKIEIETEPITPDILAKIVSTSHDPSKYGFSYQGIFENILIPPGVSPKFPLDFFEDRPPICYYVDSNKNIIENKNKDYAKLKWIDYQTEPEEFDIPLSVPYNLDIITNWINQLKFNFQKKIGITAWHLLTTAADRAPAISWEGEFWSSYSADPINRIKAAMASTKNKFTDLYLPTYTYDKIRKNLDLLIDDELPSKKILRNYKGKDVICTRYGVNIRHAPELAYWQDNFYQWKDDFGIAIDNSKSNIFIYGVNGEETYPTMFTKYVSPCKIEGFIYQQACLAILDSDYVRLVR